MAEQMTDFIRQTLHSLVRRLENSNEDNLDSVSYRIDWWCSGVDWLVMEKEADRKEAIQLVAEGRQQ